MSNSQRIVLPRRIRVHTYLGRYDNSILTDWGFTFSGEVDRFQQVAFLPEGWTTSYLSPDDGGFKTLVDPQGNIRASLHVYLGVGKADPDAWIDVYRRFSSHWNPFGQSGNRNYQVKDRKYGGKVIWDGPEFTREEDPHYHEIEEPRLSNLKGITWLNENYPDWEDVNAYWEKD